LLGRHPAAHLKPRAAVATPRDAEAEAELLATLETQGSEGD
jgi:hypothetical protein